METKLKKLPDALPHCMYFMEIGNKKVNVEVITNLGNYKVDHQAVGFFGNIAYIDVFDSTGGFIATVRSGQVTGIEKIRRCGLKLEVWLSKESYLFY